MIPGSNKDHPSFFKSFSYAMEAIVDLATQELHPLAKRAKDIAAASVYVLSITAAIVGLLVFAHALDFI